MLKNPSDLQNLRLVDKRFYAAVGQSAINICPKKSLTSLLLLQLGQMFPYAASLDLSNCRLLYNESLKGIHNLFPHLKQLNLRDCSWLKLVGVASLRGLSQLQFLSLERCSGLAKLPERVSGLGSLQHLNLESCRRLRSLPEGISRLSLQTLNLSSCTGFEVLPDVIGALSLLQRLDLTYCRWVNRKIYTFAAK